MATPISNISTSSSSSSSSSSSPAPSSRLLYTILREECTSPQLKILDAISEKFGLGAINRIIGEFSKTKPSNIHDHFITWLSLIPYQLDEHPNFGSLEIYNIYAGSNRLFGNIDSPVVHEMPSRDETAHIYKLHSKGFDPAITRMFTSCIQSSGKDVDFSLSQIISVETHFSNAIQDNIDKVIVCAVHALELHILNNKSQPDLHRIVALKNSLLSSKLINFFIHINHSSGPRQVAVEIKLTESIVRSDKPLRLVNALDDVNIPLELRPYIEHIDIQHKGSSSETILTLQTKRQISESIVQWVKWQLAPSSSTSSSPAPSDFLKKLELSGINVTVSGPRAHELKYRSISQWAEMQKEEEERKIVASRQVVRR